jgi:hypothetical protein
MIKLINRSSFLEIMVGFDDDLSGLARVLGSSYISLDGPAERARELLSERHTLMLLAPGWNDPSKEQVSEFFQNAITLQGGLLTAGVRLGYLSGETDAAVIPGEYGVSVHPSLALLKAGKRLPERLFVGVQKTGTILDAIGEVYSPKVGVPRPRGRYVSDRSMRPTGTGS